MNLPTNEFETFEQLVQQAHNREGPYLSTRTKNELEGMARKIGYDFDEDTVDMYNKNNYGRF